MTLLINPFPFILLVLNWAKVNGTLYKKTGFIVLPEKVEEHLIFGKIHDIILTVQLVFTHTSV